MIKGIEIPGVIKIDNVNVYGLQESIIASGYPMKTEIIEDSILEDDKKRATKLGSCKPGTGHDCFLKGIIIQLNLQAPEYFWRQWDRYHHNDYVSSQSKMHKILEFNIDEKCNKYVLEDSVDILEELIDSYNNFEVVKKELEDLGENFLELRNKERIEFTKENIYKLIISNVPSGFTLAARVTLNYLQAKSMLLQRNNHKLDEWHYICEYFKTLPEFKRLVLGEHDE